MSAAQDALRNQLTEFMRDIQRNKWICTCAYKVYVRRDINKLRFWIASVEVYKSGQGTFRDLILPTCEKTAQAAGYQHIIVENVGDPRFADFFRKLGWQEVSYGGIPSFTKQL